MRHGESRWDGDDGMQAYDRWLVWHHASRLLRGNPTGHGERELVDWGDQALLEASLAVVAPVARPMVDHFYEQLFLHFPHYRRYFPAQMDGQSDRLLAALLALVNGFEDKEALIRTLKQLGRDHRKFGIRAVHFTAVGKTLLTTLARFSGSAWTPQIEQAWLCRFQAAATTMIVAAEADTDQPPYWYATVVHHRPTAPEKAVLKLRPHHPYEYAFGQHATIESPLLPRVWRPFPLIAEPRLDGLLEFEIVALGDGGLGDILMDKTVVGDTLRLGAPIG
ncbi:hemoglobin-like flavoprotein [Allocatelliglobosispora scoriae]|uniref:nitric oxide dioxygenase n=1 Tax=Allocatelliglobosispora scoriae TaxID=643052 RepID=A0A841BQ48_9ACTN|nr:globin domain-containing protein [Allocatelliglobosispora scoriae]MBB5868950.1 hemoglobin-like flavoprotein [Allocatelliglobosispora scoriae]